MKGVGGSRRAAKPRGSRIEDIRKLPTEKVLLQEIEFGFIRKVGLLVLPSERRRVGTDKAKMDLHTIIIISKGIVGDPC